MEADNIYIYIYIYIYILPLIIFYMQHNMKRKRNKNIIKLLHISRKKSFQENHEIETNFDTKHN